ncbi:RFA3 protein, partial [Alcedo cyanopectus]|nr:RFA3 protein [Ceyx cyanopectus]
MGDIHEQPRRRIATGQLAQAIGQPVCFVGRVEKVRESLGSRCPSGRALRRLDEEISGVIEVVGRVTNQATIMCMSYVQFREDKSPFDLELYNEALKIIHEFPEYFPFG